MDLPESLYTSAQVREMDRRAIAQHGLPGSVLMQRAGEAVFALLRERWPRTRRLAVVCGPGNNGSDGYIVARLAQLTGLSPQVMSLGATPSKGEAAAARQACAAAGVAIQDFEAHKLSQCDVIVDALLGTGLERDVDNEWRAAVEAINASHRPILSVDIPSGLHADSGRVMGAAVRAHSTLTFIGLKTGLFTGAGREFSGEMYFADLGVSSDVYLNLIPCARRLTGTRMHGLLPTRTRHSHKGNYGHVLILGGDRGMAGAARLAGVAAYRAGAGLVTVATHPMHVAQVGMDAPELLAQGVNNPADLRRASAHASVLAVGPGLGQGDWGRRLFAAAMEASRPMVVDADGLNLLARDPEARPDWVLTPHPGEAGRLLGIDAHEVQRDRIKAVRAIAQRYSGVCVLKGSGTLIATADNDTVDLCDRGNPGMASGGMGDVLTGAIAALLAQGLTPREAGRLGVWLHASAGDDAARHGGEVGMIATDLMPFIRAHLNRMADDARA